ncbi:MAG TPA: DUF6368 family protein [Gemmataceae bacterium]|nr:DUF6368 family protein [Gemmataceae bacterium]
MGGPACGLWVPHGSLAVVETAAEQMVRAIAVARAGGGAPVARSTRRRRRPVPYPRRHFYFDVADTGPIGGRAYQTTSPLYCALDVAYRDEVAEVEVLDSFGFPPDPVHWSLGAFVNSDDVHRSLADVAAHLAEQTGGVIDFGRFLEAAADLPGAAPTVGGTRGGRGRRSWMPSPCGRGRASRAAGCPNRATGPTGPLSPNSAPNATAARLRP